MDSAPQKHIISERRIAMKKVLVLSSIVVLGSLPACAEPMLPPQMMGEFQSFQGQAVHDMNYIMQQKFKQEEINEMRDIEEQKAEKNRELEAQEPAIKRIFGKKPAQQNVQFTEENGEIKIKSAD